MMPQPCALCLQHVPLVKSHFLPAGFYKRLRTLGDKNPNPVLMSRDIAIQKSYQMTDPLLCSVCDRRFSTQGEAYVLPRIRQDDTFPFLDHLKVALEFHRGPGFNAYQGERVGVDTQKIAFFGLSLLWRAGVHKWRMADGKATSVMIDEPYKNDLRRNLLGESGFPPNCNVMVTIATDWASQNGGFVPNRIQGTPLTAYGLMTKGLYFRIFFGTDVPKDIRQLCCVTGPGRLIFTRDCEDDLLETWRKLIENCRAVGNLSKSRPKQAA